MAPSGYGYGAGAPTGYPPQRPGMPSGYPPQMGQGSQRQYLPQYAGQPGYGMQAQQQRYQQRPPGQW